MANILVVEDNKTTLNGLTAVLSESGHKVYEASDGAEGIEKAIEQDNIDLILTDLHLPRKNGVEMISELRNYGKFKKTEVIFYTTETNETLKTQGKKLGVRYCFIKPVPDKILIESIQKVLERGAEASS